MPATLRSRRLLRRARSGEDDVRRRGSAGARGGAGGRGGRGRDRGRARASASVAFHLPMSTTRGRRGRVRRWDGRESTTPRTDGRRAAPRGSVTPRARNDVRPSDERRRRRTTTTREGWKRATHRGFRAAWVRRAGNKTRRVDAIGARTRTGRRVLTGPHTVRFFRTNTIDDLRTKVIIF